MAHDPAHFAAGTSHLQGQLKRHARTVPPHPNEAASEVRTFGERVADGVAAMAGSWSFILVFISILAGWIAWNGSKGDAAFDPYPFILLNLMLSCVAALQAPIIMMSQNRQAARDRLHADLDYQVNVKAELELVQLRAELNELKKQQWEGLITLQREQLVLLERIVEKSRQEGGDGRG